MDNLKFKNGSGEFEKLPKVYFSCHPVDFNKYFDMLTDEIQLYSDCVICYFDPGEEVSAEEIRDVLNSVQLAVFPITEKFLRRKSRALDTDIKEAIKSKMPLLPIIVEPGVESEFNLKCGELQCLDRCSADPTAIGYKSRLKSFLDAVIIKEETAEKIRGAFDAYIFLSYRKKDRVYANELMKLIHKNEFCRDIAIWFDEYLVPGENFNNAIIDAMKKSSLFAMVVTPNLVNEKNYVETDEYPFAIELGMPILPSEAVPTDRTSLEKSFRGIPECILKEDEKSLAEALSRNLKNIALGTDKNNPVHTYLIGLAYFYGIDVEINYERAVSLIEKAAEEGVCEALEKLISIRGTGAFFDGNYEEYCGLCMKLLSILKEQEKTSENAEKRMEIMLKMCLGYEKLKDYKTPLKRCEEMLEAECESASGENASDNRIALISFLGRAYINLQRYADAVKTFERAKEEIEKSPEKGRDEKLFHWYNSVAVLLSRMYRLEESEKYFREAEKIIGRLGKEKKQELTYTLAVLYDNYADVLMRLGNPSGAAEKSGKTVDVYREAAADLPAVFGLDYAIACDNLGVAYMDKGMFFDAEKQLLEAEKTFRKLEEEFGERYIHDALKNQNFLGSLYSDSDPEKAEYHYGKAMEMFSKISSSGIYDNTLADIYNDMAVFYRKQGEFEKALSLNESALSVRSALAEVNPEVYLSHVAKSWNNLGKIYTDSDNPGRDYGKGIEYINKAVELYGESYKGKIPAEIGFTLKSNLLEAYILSEDTESAIDCFDELSKIAGKLPGDGFEVIKVLGQFAAFCYKKEKFNKALKLYIRISSELEKINLKTGGRYWFDAAEANNNVALLSVKKDKATARKHIRRALELYRLIDGKLPGVASEKIERAEKFIRDNNL